MKRFIDGIALGLGFGIAFFGLAFVYMQIALPGTHEPTLSGTVGASDADKRFERTFSDSRIDRPFAGLTLEERLEASSAIALLRFDGGPDGLQNAVVAEYLKRLPSATQAPQVGEGYPDASYYPGGRVSEPDAALLFFRGSGAHVTLTQFVYGGRVPGLNNIPLELLREKVREDWQRFADESASN